MHFTEDDFTRPLNLGVVKMKRELKRDEVGVCVFPSRHISRENCDEEVPSKKSRGRRMVSHLACRFYSFITPVFLTSFCHFFVRFYFLSWPVVQPGPQYATVWKVNKIYENWPLIIIYYNGCWYSEIRKVLSKIAKEKGNEDLQQWGNPCEKHLYWSATTTSNGDGKVIWAKFKSFLSHIVNKHSGLDDPKFKECAHWEIPDRRWLDPGTLIFWWCNLCFALQARGTTLIKI